MIRRPPRSTLFPTRRSSDLRQSARAIRQRVRRRAGVQEGSPKGWRAAGEDRKSTRLNSSHRTISYAVFCLKKKKNNLVLAYINRSVIYKNNNTKYYKIKYLY